MDGAGFLNHMYCKKTTGGGDKCLPQTDKEFAPFSHFLGLYDEKHY